MKILTRNSQISSYSPELMLSPTMAHVDAACRKDLVSFARKVFHVLAPSAVFQMNEHICAIAHCLEQVRARPGAIAPEHGLSGRPYSSIRRGSGGV